MLLRLTPGRPRSGRLEGRGVPFTHRGRLIAISLGEQENTMDFQHSAPSLELQERVRQFMRTHVEPVEKLYYEQVKPEAAR